MRQCGNMTAKCMLVFITCSLLAVCSMCLLQLYWGDGRLHCRSCYFIKWSRSRTDNHLDSYEKYPRLTVNAKGVGWENCYIFTSSTMMTWINTIQTPRQTFFSMFWIYRFYSVDTLRWTGDADVVLAWNEFDTAAAAGLTRRNVTTSAIPDSVAPLWPHPGFIAASEDGMLAESLCASHTKQPGGIETEWSRPPTGSAC